MKEIRSYNVEDSTQIWDKSTILASNATKNSLTLYLAQQLIDKSTVKAVTVTHKSVMANYDCQATTGVSTQEEADTLMILHAVEVAASGATVHVYTQDTDVLLTGHIKEKGKQTCFKAFMTSPPDVVSSLQMLEEGDSPSEKVLDGCEAFLCSLYCLKGVELSRASSLRWHLFKMMKPEPGGQTATNPMGLEGAHSVCPPTGRYLGPGSRAETCHSRPSHSELEERGWQVVACTLQRISCTRLCSGTG